jgi:hypothetical protein
VLFKIARLLIRASQQQQKKKSDLFPSRRSNELNFIVTPGFVRILKTYRHPPAKTQLVEKLMRWSPADTTPQAEMMSS